MKSFFCRFVLVLLLLVTGRVGSAECTRDQYGTVQCDRGQCLSDLHGKVVCSPKAGGGCGKNIYGQVECGAGQCSTNIYGQVVCSPHPGGGCATDIYGQVICN